MATARVVILHPDLGIGGAERLIVSLAVALQDAGHSVHLLTAHHDAEHCFEETRDGSLRVQCVGDWLPRSLLGRWCHALFAYFRMIYLSLYLQFFSQIQYDIFICDQISACIPFVKLFSPTAKVLFYCHFPDQLLTERKSTAKRLYRAPLDWLEEKTTGMADVVLVNSQFTGDIFRSTFRSLGHIRPAVLYPSQQKDEGRKRAPQTMIKGLSFDEDQIECLFLSVNRFERKKNIALAIEALAFLLKKVSHSDRRKVHLVLAGGYDRRVAENVEHFEELEVLAEQLGVAERVTFLKSPGDDEKQCLLQRCTCLVYTPDREHFGIVPVEAMHAGKPVIAVRSGGPKETVVDGKTGFLCEPDKESFAAAMERFVHDTSLSQAMGAAGVRRVRENFSFEAFSNNINAIVSNMLGDRSDPAK